jgi:hypothetical protein
MAVLDQQARKIIQQAQDETGIPAITKVVLISSALQGGIPHEILSVLAFSQPANTPLALPEILSRLPAVFINGKPLSYGVPDLDTVKSRLKQNTNA